MLRITTCSFILNLTIILLSFAKVIGILPPRQLRSPNARPQELSGLPEPSRGRSKVALEIIRVLGDAIGHVMFHPVPYEFGWIKLRGIPGKEVGMNTAMLFKESLDRSGLMRTAPVPEQHESSFEMPQEVSQKSQDLRMPNVLQRMKADVQGDSPFTGRNADCRDRRDLRPPSGNLKNRGLSDKSPGSSNSRDKTESALVEEDQRDFKPFGLFLYAAMNGASTVLFPFHLVLWLLFQVSGGLSQALSESSKRGRDDKSLRSGHQSLWPLFRASIGQWNSRFSRDLPQAYVPAFAFGARLVSQAYPAPVLISTPFLHFSYAGHSSNTPNSMNNRELALSPAESFLCPRALRLAVSAFQALSGFHVVAWNQYTIFPLLMRESIIYLDSDIDRNLLSQSIGDLYKQIQGNFEYVISDVVDEEGRTLSERRSRMNLNTTGSPILDMICILLIMGLLALPAAIGAIIWYAIKVWFTTKVVKTTWMGK